MKKIIIINHEPLTKKINKNFYIDGLISNNFEVEYWCVRSIMYKNFSLMDELKLKNIVEITSIQELERRVKINQKSIYIVELPKRIESIDIYRTLSNYNCNTYELDMYSACHIDKDNKFKYIKYYSVNRIKKIIKNYFVQRKVKISWNKYEIKPIKNKFICGMKKTEDNSSNIISINNFDYEDYKNSLDKEERLINYKYCVFIDQYLPYHPDFKIKNCITIEPEIYYTELQKMLKHIEKNLKIKVIIAAHPKSDYRDQHLDDFKCIKYKTKELIKYSEFIILHDSLALSYGVLYEKPMIFAYMNKFRKLDINILERIKYLSEYLGSSSYEFSYRGDIKIKEVNKELYDKYKYRYLTSKESEIKSNIDILVDEFSNI